MKHDYDLIVIGGGAAGLTAAGMGANFGARTMLVEADRLGGDCTWRGCIPSKTLLRASKMQQTIENAADFGHATAKDMSFEKIMQHVRKVRQHVYDDADEPGIYRKMGVDVEFGYASFLDKHNIEVERKDGSEIVSSRFFIIATGSSAVVPTIEGLEKVPYYTNESLFELTEQPDMLTIIGAGPIGIEMAQAFQRLGTQVMVIDKEARILVKDDDELAGMMLDHLREELVDFKLSAAVTKITRDNGKIHVHGEREGKKEKWVGDSLLMATGRTPNIDRLKLENAGVEYQKQGIIIDDRCRTSQRHIFAAGDVTGRYQFTHMSEHMAKVAATNALIGIPMKIDKKHITWCTYTDPELAHVGASERQLKDQGTSYEVFRFPYNKIDRAITENREEGLIKIFARKRSGKILGVSILGAHAGELISEYAVAMRNEVSLRNIADTIHPYPSYGLGARRAADQWYIRNQSGWMIKIIKKVFGYRGSIPDLSDPDRIV